MLPPRLAALALAALAAPRPGWALLDCKNIRVDGHSFDLLQLKGPHSVVTTSYDSGADAHHNTTYTLDVCGNLKKSGGGKDAKAECPNGTRVCAIRHLIQGETDVVEKVVAVAGSLENVGGSQFEYETTRLSTSDSNSDSEKEGLRLVLKGGKHPLDGKVSERREQRAVIEFLCAKDKTGDEGEWEAEDKYDGGKLRRRADGDEGDDGDGDGDGDDDKERSSSEHQLKKDGAALVWKSYGREKDADVLRLEWHTKYACEKRDGGSDDGGDKGEDDGGSDRTGSHWGFFTWFIVIVFLGTAAYLIFGSWLNYNRYGARGWDLLPHGDAVRDVPYLFKDWLRRVLNTVQGTGSRGGYSAV